MEAHELQGEIFSIPAPAANHEPGPNRQALEVYLAELEEHGLLTGKAAVLGNSLRSIADAVDRGMNAPKVSIATTTLTKTLHEGLAELPEIRRSNSGDAYDTLTAIIGQLSDDALTGRLDDDAPEY